MYQSINLIVPIITIPYISRVLGAEGLGKYSLTNAYAQYFILFGMIGLGIYCSREVAYIREDKTKLNKVFWELNFLRFITMGMAIILYFVLFGILIESDDIMLNFIQGLWLLSSLVDISWLFIGLENFKKVVIRNCIVKIVSMILVFIFVKEISHVWLYALILSGSQFLGQAIMWFDIPKDIKFILPKKNNILVHLGFSIKLFLPQVAINVYTMLDKIMLGTISTEVQVGMYDNSQRVIKIAITLVTTLAAVTIPKMANLYKNGDVDIFIKNVYRSFSFVSFLAFPMAFGLMSICRNFIPWFYGEGFQGIEMMFYFGSWLMITLAWSSIVGSQVLISTKRDKKFTIAVTVGALVNIIFNFILIREFEGVGTTISSVLAEFTGMFIMVYFVRDIVDVKKMFKPVPKYFMVGLLMFIITWNLGDYLEANIIGTVIQCCVGAIIYIGMLFILKDENLKYGMEFIKNKVSKKEKIEANNI